MADWMVILLVVAGYLAVQLWILPKLGVDT